MSVEKKVPEIRFKGFNEPWNTEKIQDLIDRHAITSHLDGNHGELYPRANEFSNSGIPYISANDFVTGLISFTGCKYLPTQRALQFKKGIAKDGDILFAHNATVGPVAKLTTSYEFVILSTTATYFRCDNKTLINDYLLQALSNKKFVEQYSRVMAQSTRNQVPITVQRKFSISIPENTSEQTAIGNTFQKLDNLINQHQQKHDKLSNIKKAMLEKMFPKQGEAIPEIRFKGFSGEWEEKELGIDVADIVGGGTPSTSISEFWGGDIDWYSPTEIGSSVYAEGSQKKITTLGLKSSSATILPAGNTVLFTSRAGIGDMAILTRPGTTNQGFQSFVVKEGFSTYFIYSAGKQIKEYALKHASGSTFLEISGKQLGRMKILVPCETEQTAIGNYFQKLDELINQHQQQIIKLNNIKQACLSKMFV